MNFLTAACTASPSTGRYRLDDNGTNAALFGGSLLPTIAPARNRAVYECTGSAGPLVATPASLVDPPGFVEVPPNTGVRVCGFKVNGVTSSSIQRFIFYTGTGVPTPGIGRGDELLFAAAVEVGTGGDGLITFVTATPFGSYPLTPISVGAAAGLKIAMMVERDYTNIKCHFFINGTLVGTSGWWATTVASIFGSIYVDDAYGAGTIDIECVPDAAALATGYGTFDTGAVDMVGTVI